jgi:hypothetical protein
MPINAEMPTLPLLYIILMGRRKVLLFSNFHFPAVALTKFPGVTGEIWREESDGLSRQAFSNLFQNFNVGIHTT